MADKKLLDLLSSLPGGRLGIKLDDEDIIFVDLETRKPVLVYDVEAGCWETEVGSGWEPDLQEVFKLAIARKEERESQRKEE